MFPQYGVLEWLKTSLFLLLNHSEYCVLNDSVIREKDGDGLLIIINDTGDWLVVTNGSNLFVFPSNGSNCEDDVYNPNIVMYAMQTFLYGVAFLLTTFIIILHLCFKELQTVFGILTILFCFFFNADDVILFVHNRYQFTHTVNDSGEVCTVFVFVYTRGLFSSNLHTSCTVLTEQDWRDIEPIIGWYYWNMSFLSFQWQLYILLWAWFVIWLWPDLPLLQRMDTVLPNLMMEMKILNNYYLLYIYS